MEKKGFFNFFSKPRAEESEGSDASIDQFCQSHLQTILDACGFDTAVTMDKKGEQLYLNIESEEDAGRIIGKDGSTLSSLQTLIRASVMKKFAQPVKVLVDVGGYRDRRNESVRGLAMTAAQAILQGTQKEVALRPMSSADRLQVHTMFQDDARIKTYSRGEGHERYVVLATPD